LAGMARLLDVVMLGVWNSPDIAGVPSCKTSGTFPGRTVLDKFCAGGERSRAAFSEKCVVRS
jgi:hypothetical protein